MCRRPTGTRRNARFRKRATPKYRADQPLIGARVGLSARYAEGYHLINCDHEAASEQYARTNRAVGHMTAESRAVLRLLGDKKLLLVQDKHLPNIVQLITGETVHGSWWTHPKGRVIFAVLEELADDPNVLFTKLLHTKVTLIHRKLWRPFLTVVSSGGAWQVQGLSAAAQRVLTSAKESQSAVVSSGQVVKELEARLLARTRQVHTDSGRHAIVVEPWTDWARQANVKTLGSVAVAKKQIEEAARAIGASITALPWHREKSAAT